MKVLSTFGVIALGIISFGGSCGVKTPDIKTASENVKESSQNVKEASQKISDGMKELSKIDPAGLKHLMEQNDQLRGDVEALRGELNSIQSPGNIGVGPHSRAFLEITGYKGRLRVDAWLDSEANKFINNRVLVENEVPLAVGYAVASQNVNGLISSCQLSNNKDLVTMLASSAIAQITNACVVKKLPNTAASVDAAYKKDVTDALSQFLAKPFVIPSADMGVHDFGQRFGQSGEHSLYFRVTPEKEDSQGNWEFEYKAYVQEPNGDKEQFLVGRIDSQTSKNYKLGEPLAPVLANVFKVVVGDK